MPCPYPRNEHPCRSRMICPRWKLSLKPSGLPALKPSRQPPYPFPPLPTLLPYLNRRFISSLLKWNKRVLDGTFEPDPVPLRGCLRGCALQCGTARIPLRGRDEVKFYPTSRHAVVFCNNRVFRLDLLEGEGGERQVMATRERERGCVWPRRTCHTEFHVLGVRAGRGWE